MIETFQFRLYPNKQQREFFSKQFGCNRYAYNWALETRTRFYQEEGKKLSYEDMTALFTQHKKQEGKEFLKEVQSSALNAAIMHNDAAFSAFFKKTGKYPKFKSKHNSRNSSTYSQHVFFRNSKLIYIPKAGDVNINLHRSLPEGKIKTCTVTRNKANQYFISILVKTDKELPVKLEPVISNAIGLDLGIKTFATLSDGRKFNNPKHLLKSLKKLKKLSRQHSKSKKGSKNKDKKRIKLAKCHLKISNQRKDFQHKLSAKLVSENQTICVEDLNVKGMVQNRRLSRAISDCSWSQFITFLKYKADRAGVNVVEIGRFEPSSKMCSCGQINNKLTLADRHWTCSCGRTHDRDVLAAQNIRKFAFCKSPASS